MLVRFKQILDEVGDLKPINKLEINTEGLQLLTNSPLLVRI
jgi:16S rRNA U516 pseudouridylate synthase RsuA-like enzyme